MSLIQYLRPIHSAVRSRTARAAYTYVISSGLNTAIPFLLLPVLTRLLGPADFGYVAMFQALFSIANTFTMFGLRAVVLRNLTVDEKGTHADYLASNLAIVGTLSAAALVIVAIAVHPIRKITGLSFIWIELSIVCGGCMTVFQLYLTTLQARQQAIIYALVQNSMTLGNLAFSLILILALNMGWAGRILGTAISVIAGAAGTLVYLHLSRQIGEVRKAHVKESLALAGASVPHALANIVLSYSDRFFLGAHAPVGVVGIYAAANQLATILWIFGYSVSTATTPWIYSKLAGMRSRRDLTNLAISVIILALLMLLAAIVTYIGISVTLPIILPKQFLGASNYFPWLLTGFFFAAVYFLVVPALFYYKRTAILSMSGIFILFAGLAMIHVLSGLYGPRGVAMAMCGARFLLFAITCGCAVALTLSDSRIRPSRPA